MWVCFKTGFVSVVQHRDKPKRVLVRARRKQDLEEVMRVWSEVNFHTNLKCPKIQTDTKADYMYRVNMAKSEWAGIVAVLATKVDYDNFKNAVEDKQLLAFAHQVWYNGLNILGNHDFENEEGLSHG